MSSVATLAFRCTLVLILGFFVVTFWKLLTQGIGLKGLLADGQGNFSPGRAQMLMVTLMMSVQYLAQAMRSPSGFPDIPNFWLVALGASHGIYLGGKAYTIFTGNRSNQS